MCSQNSSWSQSSLNIGQVQERALWGAPESAQYFEESAKALSLSLAEVGELVKMTRCWVWMRFALRSWRLPFKKLGPHCSVPPGKSKAVRPKEDYNLKFRRGNVYSVLAIEQWTSTSPSWEWEWGHRSLTIHSTCVGWVFEIYCISQTHAQICIITLTQYVPVEAEPSATERKDKVLHMVVEYTCSCSPFTWQIQWILVWDCW